MGDDKIRMEPETLLEFRLDQEVTINAPCATTWGFATPDSPVSPRPSQRQISVAKTLRFPSVTLAWSETGAPCRILVAVQRGVLGPIHAMQSSWARP